MQFQSLVLACLKALKNQSFKNHCPPVSPLLQKRGLPQTFADELCCPIKISILFNLVLLDQVFYQPLTTYQHFGSCSMKRCSTSSSCSRSIISTINVAVTGSRGVPLAAAASQLGSKHLRYHPGGPRRQRSGCCRRCNRGQHQSTATGRNRQRAACRTSPILVSSWAASTGQGHLVVKFPLLSLVTNPVRWENKLCLKLRAWTATLPTLHTSCKYHCQRGVSDQDKTRVRLSLSGKCSRQNLHPQP